MAGNLQETLEQIREKAGLLTERYIVLRKEKEVADTKIAELELTIRSQEQELNKLRQENEYLKVVSIAVPDHKDVEKSRAKLIEMVREIDKCILELSE